MSTSRTTSPGVRVRARPRPGGCTGGGRRPVGRREFLQRAGGGLGGLALAALLRSEARAVAPDHAPRARAVVQIFCAGGMSHLDTFDYKPELERRAGQPFDPGGELQFFASRPGACQPSYWKFRRHGESGRWVSDLLPKLAGCVDDMAFIYSMRSQTALHGPASFLMNTGQSAPGSPSMGAWVTYGLGSDAHNLPAFVVLPDVRGLPPGGVINWGAGYLPAQHQGVALDLGGDAPPIPDLFPPEAFRAEAASGAAGLDFLEGLNRAHQRGRAGNTALEARIEAYEMAARLQLAAPEATSIAGESPATRRLYALDHPDAGPFGRQCLLARRLVERGVRFVQIYCGAENTTAEKIRPNWDSHEDVVRDHGYWGAVLDSGAAALLKDLKGRGLLDETLVICTTEFGRQPGAQAGKGRDHNAAAFTTWLAGGGVRPGVGYGSTDELGFEAVDNVVHSYELHATALHLLGIDHEELTYYHNGLDQRLTGFEGRGVIDELI